MTLASQVTTHHPIEFTTILFIYNHFISYSIKRFQDTDYEKLQSYRSTQMCYTNISLQGANNVLMRKGFLATSWRVGQL